MSRLDRNPLTVKSPSPRKADAEVAFQSPERAAGVTSFPYNEGRKNSRYLSPTFRSSVLGSSDFHYQQLRQPRTPNTATPSKAIHESFVKQSTQEKVIVPQLADGHEVRQSYTQEAQHTESKAISNHRREDVVERITEKRENAYELTLSPAGKRSDVVSPSRLRRSPHPDNQIFAGADHSPRRTTKEEAHQVVQSSIQTQVQTQNHTLTQAQNEVQAQSLADGQVVCMVCANEDLVDAKRRHEEDLAERERQAALRQAEIIRHIEIEREEHRRQLKEAQKREAQAAIEENERRKRAEAEARRLHLEEDAQNEARKIREAELLARTRAQHNENVRKYKSELDAQLVVNSARKQQEKEEDAAKDRLTTGLPVGGYHWDYKEELARDLRTQIDERRIKEQAEKEETRNFARRVNENLERFREKEQQVRAAEARSRQEQLNKIMEELRVLKERRLEDKRRLEDAKQEERIRLQEEAERERTAEWYRRQALRKELSSNFEQQISERKIRREIESARAKTERAVTAHPVCTHSRYVNCARCNRRIPTSGAFRVK